MRGTNTTRYLWEIIVPTKLGDTIIKPEYHSIWDQRVREISGGLTVFSPVKGQWISPDNEIFVEQMIPVRVFCTKQEIEQISDMTAKHYQQAAVMFYAISSDVAIVHYGHDGVRARKETSESLIIPQNQ